MKEMDHSGHRKRIRASYIAGNMTHATDRDLLELYLSRFIVRKDVKYLAQNLIDTFGSLENVLNADVESLMSIDGIGEVTAVAISMIRTLNKRYSENLNNCEYIKSSDDAKNYCYNLLRYNNKETFAIVILDPSSRIICNKVIRTGTVENVSIDIKELIEPITLNKGSSVILTHNHITNDTTPSMSDINLTMKINNAFGAIGIRLFDHIIVSRTDTLSMRETKECSFSFTKSPIK